MKKSDTMPVAMWAAEDIPSNKAENIGFDNLTNTELLSIIIGSGMNDTAAIELARMLLNKCDNNLKALGRMKRNEMECLKGFGKSKVTRLMAALELGRRRNEDVTATKPVLSTAMRTFAHYGFLQDLDREEFWVSYLDQSFSLIKDFRVGLGGLTETCVDVRIIMREAVLCNATIICAVHNHPSGSLSPSKADDEITMTIKNACKVMRIKFQDHVIIGHENYYSYHENGKL